MPGSDSSLCYPAVPVTAGPPKLLLLLLFVAIVAFYSPGLWPGRVLLPLDILCGSLPWSATGDCAGRTIANPVTSDQVFQFFPWHAVVRTGGWRALLWNPYAFAGSPLLGNAQSAMLYPPNWLHLWLPASWSYVLLAILRTAVAAGFTWAFARRHVSEAAAALAAVAFSFSYNFVFSVGYPLGDAIALMPVMFWAADSRPSHPTAPKCGAGWGPRRWPALALATTLELLAGQPEMALVVFLSLAFYFLAGRPSPKEALRAAVAVLVGAMCAAPQIVPLIHYLRLGAASRLRGEYNPLFYSAHTLLDFLTPQFFGASAPREAWGSNEGGYFGLLPALLALAWVLSRPRQAARNPFLWIFLFSLALIYRLPPLAWLLELPLLRALFVTKFWATATFAGAMLAAFAWDDFLERRIRFSLLCLLSAAFCLVLLLACWHFRELISALQLSSFENRVLGQFVVFLALALLVLRFRPSLAVAVLLIESYVYLGRYNTAAPVSLLYPRTPVVDFLQRDPERARIMGDGVLPPNTAAVYGLEDVRGYDAITPWSYFRYMTAIDSTFPDLWAHLDLDTLNSGRLARDTLFLRDRFERPLQKWGRGYLNFLHRVHYWNDRLARLERPALFDLLNVKYYLVPRGGKPPPGAEDYRLVFSGEADAYENPHRMPRAFVVEAWEFAPDPESALSMIRRPGFDPRTTAVFCCRAPGGSSVPGAPSFCPAEILNYTATEVVVRGQGPGALVLADRYDPGWRAPGYVLYSADYLFRGVLLPPGTHTVSFSYRPWLDF